MAASVQAIAQPDALSSGVALYQNALPAAGSLVETYLERTCHIPLSRVWGVDRHGNGWEGVPPALRFAPSVWMALHEVYRPAMLAPVQDVDGAIIGVQITYLFKRFNGDVSAITRETFGMVRGAAIRLGAVRGHKLALALTIEQGLSVLAMQTAPDPPVWIGITPANIAGGGIGHGHKDPLEPGRLLPSTVPDIYAPGILPPDGVREITLIEGFHRNPPVDRAVFDRACHRFYAAGIAVRRLRPPQGRPDFNRALKELG